MDPWLLIFLFIVALLLAYALAFYLGSLLNPGSPLRIRLAYLWARATNRLHNRQSSGGTESYRRTLYPTGQPAGQESSAPSKPQEIPAQPKPERQPARTNVPRPATGTVPSAEPLSRHTVSQAIAERRRLWIKYLDGGRAPVTDKLEIYRTTIDGMLLAWLHSKRKCDAFPLRRIVAWQLLDETFERSEQVERWATREARLGLPKRLYHLWHPDNTHPS